MKNNFKFISDQIGLYVECPFGNFNLKGTLTNTFKVQKKLKGSPLIFKSLLQSFTQKLKIHFYL